MTATTPYNDSLLTVALRRNGVRADYQPIVELASGRVVAYEALIRVPTLPDVDVTDLFAAARRAGRLTELEWTCRRVALQGALDAELREQALFVNTEPLTYGATVPHDVAPVLRRAAAELQLVAELTERDVLRRPAEVLRGVALLRSAGVMIALDDIGVTPDSLALLEFVRPDVIKLDMSVTQHVAGGAQTLMAVFAYCERTQAHLLAEGIETERHRTQSLAIGATFGQGWLFGRAGALPTALPSGRWTRRATSIRVATTPFTLVAGTGRALVGGKDLLVALVRDMERQAARADRPVVLACFQQASLFTAGARRRYAAFAATSPLVAVFAAGMPEHPLPGVRGVSLSLDDPLCQEWTLVVLGAHYAAAVIAREIGDPTGTAEDDRLFRFVVTHDRDLVTAAGRSLLSRMNGGEPG